jgi:hypothetical protein
MDAARREHQLVSSQNESMTPLGKGRCAVWELPRVIDHEPAALLEGLVARLGEFDLDG